tara:strand:+ start:1337 stop:1861 length:525 start_codon:yes stop_codon:yes gene_type:complete
MFVFIGTALACLHCAHASGSKIVTLEDNRSAKLCPLDNVITFYPEKGLGTLSCHGRETWCDRFKAVTCVGIKSSKKEACFDWKCHGIPEKMNAHASINISGPEYTCIEIKSAEYDPADARDSADVGNDPLMATALAMIGGACMVFFPVEIFWLGILGALLSDDNDGYTDREFSS